MAQMTDPLVTASWLANHLQQPDMKVIDASWFMPGSPRDPWSEFLTGHIPGASFFGIDDVCDRNSNLPHMLADAGSFEKAARRIGVNTGDTLIIYDSQGLFSAPRVWWNFRVMGHEASFVLDGGLIAWTAEGRPIEAGNVAKSQGDFCASPNRALVCDLAHVWATVEKGDAQIVDARPSARFLGHVPEPRAGLRSGHMPGALNLPFSDLIKDFRLESKSRLLTHFERAGIDLSEPIITTCGSGISASVLALAFARTGRFDAVVYDGSWTEWAGRPDTPVVQDL